MPDPTRFNILAQPQAAPGCCLACRTAQGPFVDLGFSINFHGRVYICVGCIREMSRALPRVVTSEDAIKAKYQERGIEIGREHERQRFSSAIGSLVRDLALDYSAMAESAGLPKDTAV